MGIVSKKQFYRFTDGYTGEAVYIDLSIICAIKERTHNSNPNTLSSSISVDSEARTIIVGHNIHFEIAEHISEVIAILEGRDPTPARILFKGRNGST